MVTEPPEEIGASRVGEAIVAEVAAGEDFVNEGYARRGPVAHRDGYRPIELDDRRSGDAEEKLSLIHISEPTRRS